MAITTDEFERQLGELLDRMEQWQRCEWCGCNDRQRRFSRNSPLCNSCVDWKRKEESAITWLDANPTRKNSEQYMRVEYNVKYAALCREEGQICSWKGPVMSLDLEWELQSISERFCGEDVFGGTTFFFEQFSEEQRRLLMFLLEELTKVWIRHRRRSFAIDQVMQSHFPRKGSQ